MDNARQGRQSLTKKISFHDKHTKNYRTIESLQKEPTKKKITLNQYHFKKESHPVITSHSISKNNDRKIKSLSKYEVKKLTDSTKKRSVLGSEPELATIDGLLSRNMQMVKFSMSKDRDRIMTKQKYKRSEQVRSLLDNKKMSSVGKERRDTENSSRALQGGKTNALDGAQTNKAAFKEIDLSTVINSNSGKEHQITLQDCFEEGCFLFYQYLSQKEERLTQGDSLTTLHLKAIKQQLNSMLEEANAKFKAIHAEVGEMSCKNLLMLASVLFQQGKFNEVIMWVGRVLEKTEGNLFLLHLPGPQVKPNQSLTFLNTEGEQRHYNLNLLGYLILAEAYKSTNNYLCCINVINKCQHHMRKHLRKSNSLKHLKHHYQTLQPKQSEDFSRGDIKPAIKKKSYMLSVLRPQPTANKFKKHSHTNSHNFSSIDLAKSKKNLQTTQRNDPSVIDESEEEAGNIKQHQSLMVHESTNEEWGFKEYSRETASLYLLLARSYIKIKSYDLAIPAYKKCLQVNPRKMEALLELASLYHLKYSSRRSLEWLHACQQRLEREQGRDHRWQLDYSYILYHKALILLQQGKFKESYQLFNSINAPQLSSQVNYYKGVIKLKDLNNDYATLLPSDKNQRIQSILMSFNQSITAFTSREYLVKSYFYILLILVFEKKDYYGAQYEVNRFRKIMPHKAEIKEDERIGFSRISRIYQDDELFEKEAVSSGQSGWGKDSYLSLLFEIIDGIICVLKMKIVKGIAIFKEVSLKVENNGEDIIRYYGHYYGEIIKLQFQFKFYGYYILRQYELSLKHVNKLLQILEKEGKKYKDSALEIRNAANIEVKLITVNKLMLECIILMKQGKFNYAMSKLTQIQTLINQPGSLTDPTHTINTVFILNNFNMVKSLCYINLYCQLEHEKQNQPSRDSSQETQDNNKEILLSAEQLLRHCLISDKQNSLIYYLISVLYYQLEQYESSLKYIRQALEFSDDHMIKHYFCKANTKFMLGRYDEAIKDYTNAIIVYKEQNKNESEAKDKDAAKKPKMKEQQEQQYYSQKQIMFNEIYLNRAITYIKCAYELSATRDYAENSNLITSYKMKACEDLIKYFNSLDKQSVTTEKQLRNNLLLFMHTDDPGQLIEVNKTLGKAGIVGEEDIIKVYYSIKELNNCIVTLRSYISQLDHRLQQRHQQKLKKDSIPTKHKKISMTLPKRPTETVDAQKLSQLRFDLRCLQSLKKSSSKSQGALQEALISLLEMTEEIYRKREEELSSSGMAHHQNLTLQNLFLGSCGEIFKWSDILFFIGVIHFQLKEYETAIKYFEESENEKKANGTLYSLAKYLNQVLKRTNPNEEEEEYLFFELEALFENRIYCKQQLDYNIGICYLMLRKYKQAYYYLQNYPNFLIIIKKAITIEKEVSSDNEFLSKDHPQHHNNNYSPMLIDQPDEPDPSPTKRYQSKVNPLKLPKKKVDQDINVSGFSSLSESFSATSNKESENDAFQNITPFPTHNRLCSIYSPKIIEDKKFYLSFCLPKVDLSMLGLFHEQEVEPAQRYSSQEQSSSNSDSSRLKQGEERPCKYPVERGAFESVARQISLLDLEMKPIAPWIRQNTCGVIFTQNLVNESVQLNSERLEKRKEKEQGKEDKKGKKDRYTDDKQQQR